MKITDWWQHAVTSTVPTDSPDPEAGVMKRMLWFGIGFATAIGPLYLLAALRRPTPHISWAAVALVAAGIAMILRQLHRRRDYRRALFWFHATTFVGVLIPACAEVSVNTGAFWWLTVVPFVTLLSGFLRFGALQTLLVLAYAALAFERERALGGPASMRLYSGVVLSTLYICAYLALATHWRQRLQHALADAKLQAQAAATAKARFLANMSHEIRTPLAGVIGAGELLASPHLGERQRAQLLALQAQSAQSLLALVNDVLDWSKLEARKAELACGPLSLRQLVFEANELYAVAAFDKGIELTSSVNPDVPLRFIGDATRLRQVLHNLVGNAVKFTARGGVHIHLALEAVDPRDTPPGDGRPLVRVDVSDSGIGISPQTLAQLFGAFVQADASVTRRYGGTGLGLAISRETAALMGGRIEARSTEGQGSTFSIVVPLQVAQASSPRVPSHRPDIVVACAHEGLARHLRWAFQQIGIEPLLQPRLPTPTALQAARVLLVDHRLLPPHTAPGPWLQALAAQGLRVGVLCPMSSDTLVGALPEGNLLFKPVRPQALQQLVDGGTPATPPAPARDRALALHVLVCEDNPVNQAIVQAMLAELGCACVMAGDGLRALEALRQSRFDVVLMDMQMPELDGMEATRRWRREEAEAGRPRVPVVAMTANTEPAESRACTDAGMDGFLAKPFGIGQLRQALQAWAPAP